MTIKNYEVSEDTEDYEQEHFSLMAEMLDSIPCSRASATLRSGRSRAGQDLGVSYDRA
jgi:hypothetical protein